MDQLQLPAACRFLEIWDLGACMFCTTLLSTGLAPNPTRRRAFFFFFLFLQIMPSLTTWYSPWFSDSQIFFTWAVIIIIIRVMATTP